jgi:hypothetical protein
MSIIISGDFDGGNPQQKDRIVRHGEKEFIVYPFSEDDDPNYKFRMDLKVSNTAQSARNVSITVDWQVEKYMELRDFFFLRNPVEEYWHFHPAEVSGTESFMIFQLMPGESYLCLHPKYNFYDYHRFIGSVEETEWIRKRLLGKSREGREIWGFSISDPKKKAPGNLVVVSRVHPYETAGSYCVEGIVEACSQPSDHLKAVLEKYNLHIIPMISPDGVYHGFGKLTSWNGVDLSKNIDMNDPSCGLLKNLIDEVKPDKYLEFHNWMFKDIDGIYFLGAFQSMKFVLGMPSQKKNGKIWKPMLKRKIFSLPSAGFKKYCKENYGSICACLEFPWFGRNIADMKMLGTQTIIALSRV